MVINKSVLITNGYIYITIFGNVIMATAEEDIIFTILMEISLIIPSKIL